MEFHQKQRRLDGRRVRSGFAACAIERGLAVFRGCAGDHVLELHCGELVMAGSRFAASAPNSANRRRKSESCRDGWQ